MVKQREEAQFVKDAQGNVYQLVNDDDDFEEEVVRYQRKKPTPKAAAKKAVPATKTTKKVTKTAKKLSKSIIVGKTKMATKKAAATKVTKSSAKATKKVTKKAAKKRKVNTEETSFVDEDEEATEEELKVLADKQEAKLYRKYKKFCKEYEKKKANNDYDSLPEWKKADRLLTSAASILVRYRGLKQSDLSGQGHLPQAVDPLRARGEAQYQEAIRISAALPTTDAELLWGTQIRNRGSDFENLITKKEYAERTKNIQNKSTKTEVEAIEPAATSKDVIIEEVGATEAVQAEQIQVEEDGKAEEDPMA